ncbi:unnamed protein product [Echinostoma caproni]|uniref:Endochitinase n=1 Tax=Echinostoma caproni TaxID=27848 RepID=A0A183AW46_9TREM|nr:unnamed protein product [Echinostoma caproni]
MKSNIATFLLIIICVSSVVADNCEEVTASAEANSVIVRSGSKGCQYRVKPDSGKPVKVFVNSTSGRNCLNVASGGKSETICPTGPTTEFTSNSAIDISAETVTSTTADATTIIASTATPSPSPTSPGNKNESEEAEPGSKPGVNVQPSPAGEGVQQHEEEKENKVEDKKAAVKPLEIHAAPSVKLVRKTRDASTSARPNDVTVYYMLDGVSKYNPPWFLLLGLFAHLVNGGL